jgi:hypothetical protein
MAHLYRLVGDRAQLRFSARPDPHDNPSPLSAVRFITFFVDPTNFQALEERQRKALTLSARENRT